MAFWKFTIHRAMLLLMGTSDGVTPNAAYHSEGCGLPLPAGITSGGSSVNFHIRSSGGLRSYLVNIPPVYEISTPAPLIFSFHGNGKTLYEQEALSQFSDPEVNTLNAIAVYPQGKSGKLSWQSAPYATEGVSDLQFVSDLIAALSSTYCVDSTRIYAAGKSNGGGFVSALACDSTLSSQIAAFAPVSGAYYENDNGTTPLDGPCQPDPCRSSIPILEFHGQADTIIPYDGATCLERDNCPLPPISSWLEGWALLNNCSEDTPGTSIFSHEGKVNKTTWTCEGHEDIVTGYWIKGLHHDWPSTEPNSDNPRNWTVLDASKIIVDFFGNHTLPPSTYP